MSTKTVYVRTVKTGVMVPVLLDEDDVGLLKGWSWVVDGVGRVCGTWKAKGPNRKTIQVRLHRLIMKAPPKTLVDHINNRPADNRRCNLRFASFSMNSINRAIPGKNYRMDPYGRWRVDFMIDNKCTYFGTFALESDAIELVKKIHADRRAQRPILAVPIPRKSTSGVKGIVWVSGFKRWRCRYRDDQGNRHAKDFANLVDAKEFHTDKTPW